MINTQSSLAAEAGPTARMVRFRASDGLLLHGLLLGDFEKVVVHVHGKCGNHYENRFLWDLAQAYSDVNIGLFLFGNRGANALTEAYGPSGLTYIGGAIERFAESVLDIDGAIAALTELGFSAVVLQGHSFGCEKVVNWARTISEVSIPLVLLSPADSYGNLQEFLDSKDTLSKEAGDRSEVPGLLQIAWSYDQSLCPYGVVDRDGNWYPVPIEKSALPQTLDKGSLSTLVDGKPVLHRSVVYVGTGDLLQLQPIEEWIGHLRWLMPNADFVVIEGGDHHLGPSPMTTAKSIARRVVRIIS